MHTMCLWRATVGVELIAISGAKAADLCLEPQI
jgi:hypothetical protein